MSKVGATAKYLVGGHPCEVEVLETVPVWIGIINAEMHLQILLPSWLRSILSPVHAICSKTSSNVTRISKNIPISQANRAGSSFCAKKKSCCPGSCSWGGDKKMRWVGRHVIAIGAVIRVPRSAWLPDLSDQEFFFVRYVHNSRCGYVSRKIY